MLTKEQRLVQYLLAAYAADKDPTWTYSQLNDTAELGLDMSSPHDRDVIGDFLGEISRHEVGCGHPMLSAFVVVKDTGVPGGGFYRLAEYLGFGKASKLKKECFAEEQMAKAVKYWTSAEGKQLLKILREEITKD